MKECFTLTAFKISNSNLDFQHLRFETDHSLSEHYRFYFEAWSRNLCRQIRRIRFRIKEYGKYPGICCLLPSALVSRWTDPKQTCLCKPKTSRKKPLLIIWNQTEKIYTKSNNLDNHEWFKWKDTSSETLWFVRDTCHDHQRTERKRSLFAVSFTPLKTYP